MDEELREKIQEIRLEVFASQNEIIQLQSEAIARLITLLNQHKDVDESSCAPIKEKIDRAATIQAGGLVR